MSDWEQADGIRTSEEDVYEAAGCEMDEFGFIHPLYTRTRVDRSTTRKTDRQSIDNSPRQAKSYGSGKVPFQKKQASSSLSDGREGKAQSGKKKLHRRTTCVP